MFRVFMVILILKIKTSDVIFEQQDLYSYKLTKTVTNTQ